MSRYAITDIHGCAKTFKDMLAKLNFSKRDKLYLLGDYIDRGPDSKGVLDLIMNLQSTGHKVFCLKGNHEEKMLLSRHDINQSRNWLTWGGKETLESFGVEKINDIDNKYLEWMAALPNIIELPDYVLVHAGLNFLVADPILDQYAMRWIRNWYEDINLTWLDGRIILHGHTPLVQTEIKEQWNQLMDEDNERAQYLDLDNGCVYSSEGKNHLCAFNMDTKELYFLENSESKISF